MAKKSEDPKLGSLEYKPRLYLEIGDWEKIKELDVGQKISMLVKGKVVGLSMSQREEGKKHGCVDLEDFEVKVAPQTLWEEMAEEDD